MIWKCGEGNANILVESKMVSPLTWVLENESEFARQHRRERAQPLVEGLACTEGIHE